MLRTKIRNILLLLSIPLLGFTQVNNTINYNGVVPVSNKTGMYSGDRYYQTIPVPTEDLTYFWKENINSADSTLVAIYGTSEIKVNDVDFDLSLSYIPTKSLASLTATGVIVDTSYWNHDVYVNGVFQNVNYDSTTWFKIEPATFDSDSNEIHPRRITAIAIYSEAKDLASYFNQPELNGYEKWVDWWSGTDELTSGTYAQPYKTLAYMDDRISDGDTVLIRSGEYIEDNGESTHCWRVYNSGVYTGLGGVNVTGVSNAGAFVSDTSTFKNIRFYKGTGSYAMRHAIANKSTFNNCFFEDGSSITYVSAGGFILNDCAFKTTTTAIRGVEIISAAQSISAHGCIFGSGITTDIYVSSVDKNEDLVLWNNKTLGGTYFFRINGQLDNWKILNNEINSKLALHISGAYTGNMIIKGNSWEEGLTSTGTNRFNWYISDSYMTDRISINNQYAYIEGNTIEATLAGDYGAIYLDAPTDSVGACYVGFNELLSSGDPNGGGISIGTDSPGSGDNYLNGTVVEGNALYMHRYYHPETDNTLHSLVSFYNTNVKFINNYVTGGLIGVVIKDTSYVHDSLLIQGNLIVDCKNSIELKGCNGVKVYGNTVYNTDNNWEGNISMYLVDNTDLGGTHGAINSDIQNNIFYDGTANESAAYIYSISTASQVGTTINHNVSYSKNNAVSNLGDWSTWQTAGYDANSYNTDPNFSSTTNLWPITPTDADGNGTDLGTDYEDILLNTSVWPNNVNTDTQDALWDIGAYKIE